MRIFVFIAYCRYCQREATLVGIILHVSCGRSIVPFARRCIISSFHSIAYHGHFCYMEVVIVSATFHYTYTARQTVTAVLCRQTVVSTDRVILYSFYTVQMKGERFLVSPYLVVFIVMTIGISSVAEEEEFIVSSGIVAYALCGMNIRRCLFCLIKYLLSGYGIHNKIDCPIAVGTIKIERSLNIVVECALISTTYTFIIERLRRSPFHVANKISHTSRSIMLHLPAGGVSLVVKRKAEGIHAIVVCHSVIAGHEIPVVLALFYCRRTEKFLCRCCSTNSSHSSVC